MMSSPSPVQVPTPQMPPPPQPSPQPPSSQPNSARYTRCCQAPPLHLLQDCLTLSASLLSLFSSGPTPSPGGFQPSPSPQPSPSSASSRTPQPSHGVPSPGPLNTPGNTPASFPCGGHPVILASSQEVFICSVSHFLLAGNPSSVMSPAGATSLEDQQYMEKLKQLSKYIEPLRRMINKIDKNEGRLLMTHHKHQTNTLSLTFYSWARNY